MERKGKLTLSQQAYQKIHTWIVNGDFPKGSVTSEGELSKRLDMSRTPVRAALQQLELEGYLRIASKHGVILLDSSSQRVSDLLEIVISMVLFSVSTSWNSQRDENELITLAQNLSTDFSRLIHNNKDDIQAFIAFEFTLLNQLILFCNNDEMTKTFLSSTSRLFWNQNFKRWQAPFTNETTEILKTLIFSITKDMESFRGALLKYLHTLKRTWN